MGLYLSLKTYIVVFQNPDKYENVRTYTRVKGVLRYDFRESTLKDMHSLVILDMIPTGAWLSLNDIHVGSGKDRGSGRDPVHFKAMIVRLGVWSKCLRCKILHSRHFLLLKYM